MVPWVTSPCALVTRPLVSPMVAITLVTSPQPRSSVSISRNVWSTRASDQPAGVVMATSNSLWSSLGRKSLPITMPSGTTARNVATVAAAMTQRWRIDQRRIARYGASTSRP